jgi:hypothetical protein
MNAIRLVELRLTSDTDDQGAMAGIVTGASVCVMVLCKDTAGGEVEAGGWA